MNMETAPNHQLNCPHHVYLYDPQQPINNPKPSWLLIAKFNEIGCAKMYIEAYEKKWQYAQGRLKIETKPRG